jgi:hypothetical protein
MTGELFKLRHDVYHSATLFHGEMARYFAALNNDATAEALSEITRGVREAGLAYNSALVALLKHLTSLPHDAEVSLEAEQAERTISILSFELRRL